jgi:hypothetical protein
LGSGGAQAPAPTVPFTKGSQPLVGATANCFPVFSISAFQFSAFQLLP